MSNVLSYDLEPRSIEEVCAEDYRRQGFLITKQLFDADTMATVRGAFEHKWAAIREDEAKTGFKDSTSLNNLFPVALHREYPELAQFLKGKVFLELCRRLIGGDAELSWNQGIIKPGKTGGRFSWHQDAHFADTAPLDEGFTCWLAVTDTTVENGTLCVAPEYYGRGLLVHERDEESGQWVCRFDNGHEPENKVPVELKAGQMLLFSRLTPHTSGANQTDGVRMAYQIGYSAPGLRLVQTGKLFGDQVPVLCDGKPCA